MAVAKPSAPPARYGRTDQGSGDPAAAPLAGRRGCPASFWPARPASPFRRAAMTRDLRRGADGKIRPAQINRNGSQLPGVTTDTGRRSSPCWPFPGWVCRKSQPAGATMSISAGHCRLRSSKPAGPLKAARHALSSVDQSQTAPGPARAQSGARKAPLTRRRFDPVHPKQSAVQQSIRRCGLPPSFCLSHFASALCLGHFASVTLCQLWPFGARRRNSATLR